MKTIAVEVLKILAVYGPLNASSIKELLGTHSAYAAVRKLVRYGFVECSWLCKLTEKGKAALQFVDECDNIGCLADKVARLYGGLQHAEGSPGG